jgi:hypothetical protein
MSPLDDGLVAAADGQQEAVVVAEAHLGHMRAVAAVALEHGALLHTRVPAAGDRKEKRREEKMGAVEHVQHM